MRFAGGGKCCMITKVQKESTQYVRRPTGRSYRGMHLPFMCETGMFLGHKLTFK